MDSKFSNFIMDGEKNKKIKKRSCSDFHRGK